MVAAERLFAERGIDAVSIRDITNEAGANSAAIHYHFGSKTALITAILDWRAAAVAARRAEWLARIEAADEPTLREVIEAFVVPTAELANDTSDAPLQRARRYTPGAGSSRSMMYFGSPGSSNPKRR